LIPSSTGSGPHAMFNVPRPTERMEPEGNRSLVRATYSVLFFNTGGVTLDRKTTVRFFSIVFDLLCKPYHSIEEEIAE